MSQITTQDTFDLFWQLYPRKEAKGEARKVWATAIKSHPAPYIVAALELQVRAGMFEDKRDDARRQGKPRDQFIKQPARWLRWECWTDEIIPRTNPASDNAALNLLRRMANEHPIIDGDPGNLLR